VQPTLKAMEAEGTPFRGILFAGLMLTERGPQLIEHNVRFGDPECETLLPRLSSDLLTALIAAADGELRHLTLRWRPEAAVTVVMAANGYPGTPEKGGHIRGIEAAEAKGAKVFHAGTYQGAAGLVANGGRVLNVTAIEADIGRARDAAYAAVDTLDFPSGFCRRDIGWREMARQRND
jgi:phosphoribosylamine--glycine ligase